MTSSVSRSGGGPLSGGGSKVPDLQAYEETMRRALPAASRKIQIHMRQACDLFVSRHLAEAVALHLLGALSKV